MKAKTKFEQAKLTDDEKDMLLTIFNKRRRFLMAAYSGMIAVAFAVSFLSINARNLGAEWAEKHSPGVEGIKWMGNLIFLEFVVVGSGVYFYVKRVLPFKRDAESGIKEIVPHEIMQREYFPLSGQYFFRFDEPGHLHHEVDEETYFNYVEGQTFNVFRGIKSGFVLNGDGKYAIL